jgi:hypothetical protein
LANLLATEQVSLGDVVCVDWNGNARGLTFARESEGAIIKPDLTLTAAAQLESEICDGRTVDTLTETRAVRKIEQVVAPAVAPVLAVQNRRSGKR